MLQSGSPERGHTQAQNSPPVPLARDLCFPHTVQLGAISEDKIRGILELIESPSYRQFTSDLLAASQGDNLSRKRLMTETGSAELGVEVSNSFAIENGNYKEQIVIEVDPSDDSEFRCSLQVSSEKKRGTWQTPELSLRWSNPPVSTESLQRYRWGEIEDVLSFLGTMTPLPRSFSTLAQSALSQDQALLCHEGIRIVASTDREGVIGPEWKNRMALHPAFVDLCSNISSPTRIKNIIELTTTLESLFEGVIVVEDLHSQLESHAAISAALQKLRSQEGALFAVIPLSDVVLIASQSNTCEELSAQYDSLLERRCLMNQRSSSRESSRPWGATFQVATPEMVVQLSQALNIPLSPGILNACFGHVLNGGVPDHEQFWDLALTRVPSAIQCISSVRRQGDERYEVEEVSAQYRHRHHVPAHFELYLKSPGEKEHGPLMLDVSLAPANGNSRTQLASLYSWEEIDEAVTASGLSAIPFSSFPIERNDCGGAVLPLGEDSCVKVLTQHELEELHFG